MSSDLDQDRIRNAQIEMLTKSGRLFPARSDQFSSFVVSGEGPPASIAYLHSLIAGGLGDSYNFYDGIFAIEINSADRLREPTLRGVETVVLQYRGAPIEGELGKVGGK